MKPRSAATLAARLIVGGVLVYAGAAKAAAPAEEFANVILNYGLLSPDLALPMAAVLPWIELALGWSLLLGVQTRTAAAGAGGMFGVFLLALGHVVLKKIPLPNCGCFGDVTHLTPAQGLMFDSLLTALCAAVFAYDEDSMSLDAWAARGR